MTDLGSASWLVAGIAKAPAKEKPCCISFAGNNLHPELPLVDCTGYAVYVVEELASSPVPMLIEGVKGGVHGNWDTEVRNRLWSGRAQPAECADG